MAKKEKVDAVDTQVEAVVFDSVEVASDSEVSEAEKLVAEFPPVEALVSNQPTAWSLEDRIIALDAKVSHLTDLVEKVLASTQKTNWRDKRR